mgnify:CR=1 FL=1
METAAQAVLAYVNSQIGKSEYNGMALREAFSAIIENADENTRKEWMNGVTLKDGYSYYVSCASLEETYRTDLFNQGKTALVAGVLASDEARVRFVAMSGRKNRKNGRTMTASASLRAPSTARSVW